MSENGRRLSYDLVRDPEKELNLFGAPKAEFYNRFRHMRDQSPSVRELTLTLKEKATAIEDPLGIELPNVVLREVG